MQYVTVIVMALACMVRSLPLDSEIIADAPQNDLTTNTGHGLWKRFVNPEFAFNWPSENGLIKMRTKRETDDPCEKLALCKLHARSQRNFFSAFELYFVNKRNAQLWDHQSRTIQDCEDRFGDCYED